MSKMPADELPQEVAAQRMQDAIRRALSTPHKPNTKYKGKSAVTGKRVGKTKARRVAKGST